MMMQRSGESLSARSFSRAAYSRAVAGSWMEQGPQITRRRSDWPVTIEMASLRPLMTVFWALEVMGISEMRS